MINLRLIEDFQKAASQVKYLRNQPHDNELLRIYGIYKQATVGDNHTPEPCCMNLRSSAKWSAWSEFRGMSKERAIRTYLNEVNNLIEKYQLHLTSSASAFH